MTYARARLDKGSPSTYPLISTRDFYRFLFKSMILDKEDGHPFWEIDHPDGYNMLILHPESKMIHWCYSHDFDFFELEDEE